MKWIGLIITILLAFICALTTVDVGFVSDDFVLIEAASETSVFQAFTSNWLGERNAGGFYRPMAVLLFKMDAALHGRNPGGYHWTNLWLHLLASLLTFLLVLRIQNDGLTATLAGAFFAVMPAHTEAIAWISGRTDLLCAVFYLLSLNLFAAINPRQSRGCLLGVLSLSAGLLAMLSKEMGYTLPLMIVVVDRLAHSRDGFWHKDRSHHYAGYFVMLGLVIGLRYFAVGHLIGGYGSEHLQIGRVFSYLSIYLNFIIEPFAILSGNNQPVHGILTAAAILLSITALFNRRTRLAMAFWWITLLPVMTICRAQYLYLPSFGIGLLLSILIRNKSGEQRSPAGDTARTVLACALVFSCLIHSGEKQKDWAHSGWVARAVETIVRTHYPVLPDGSRVVLLNPPQNNRLGMGVFQNGFAEAVRLWYGNATLEGIRVRHPEQWKGFNPETDIVFNCRGAEVRDVTSRWRTRGKNPDIFLSPEQSVRLNKSRREWTMNLNSGRQRGLIIISNLSHAVDVAQEQTVAVIEAVFADGRTETFDVLAGIHTAEWAYDRPDLAGKCRHSRAPIAITTITGHAPHDPILNHFYKAEWQFDEVGTPIRLNIRFLLSKDSDSGSSPEWTIREIESLVGDKTDEKTTIAPSSSILR